jgi:hypothetical protein
VLVIGDQLATMTGGMTSTSFASWRRATSSSACLALAVSIGLAAGSAPVGPPVETWGAFRDVRIGSKSGRHYAVLRSGDDAKTGTFELVRRRDGVEPIAYAQHNSLARIFPRLPQPNIDRDPDDLLLASGDLTQLPLGYRVVDDPAGIVLFERHGGVGYAECLTFVDAKGAKAWAHNVVDLYGAVPEAARYTMTSMWWYSAWGVVEGSEFAWVLAVGGAFRVVRLRTGEILEPTDDLIGKIVVEIREVVDGAAVLDLLAARSDTDLAPFRGALGELADDEAASNMVRLCAAILAARAGDAADRRPLFDRIAKTDHDEGLYAACNYGRIAPVGSDSLTPLVEFVRRYGVSGFVSGWPEDSDQAWIERVTTRFGEEEGGREAVRRMREDAALASRPLIDANVIALRLGETGFPRALADRLCSEDATFVAGALRQIRWAKPDGFEAFLIDLAIRGSGNDAWIAEHFCAMRTRDLSLDALPALQAILPRLSDEAVIEQVRDRLRALEIRRATGRVPKRGR